MATLGADEIAGADDPTLVSNNHFEISQGQSITIGAINYGDLTSNDVHRPISHVLRIKFIQLPVYQQFESIYTFIYEKEVIVKVSSAGDFWVGNGNTFFTTTGVRVTTGQWYVIRITFTRTKTDSGSGHDCSVGIEVHGVGKVGNHLSCKYSEV